MIFDSVIVILILLSALRGFRKGLLYMSVRILAWVGSIAAAMFLTKPVAEFFRNGSVGNMVSESVSSRLSESVQSAGDACSSLPDIISGGISTAGNGVSSVMSGMFTSMITSVLAFAAVMLGVWLAIKLIMLPVSALRRVKTIGFMDRLFGTAAGVLKGLIVVFVLLALLVPVVNLAGADASSFITSQLADSHYAKDLYNNNLLLLIADGIFS